MADDHDYDELAAFLEAYIDDDHDFLSWLGARVESVGPGELVMAIPYDAKLTNGRTRDDGRTPEMNGGVAATLVDTTGGLALRTALDDPLSGSIATITLNVNYLRPATGDLLATAEVVRAGSSIGVSEIVVESDTPEGDSEPVAIAQGAYRLFR